MNDITNNTTPIKRVYRTPLFIVTAFAVSDIVSASDLGDVDWGELNPTQPGG